MVCFLTHAEEELRRTLQEEEAFHTSDSNLQPFADPLGRIELDGDGPYDFADASMQHGTVTAGAVLHTVVVATTFYVHCTAIIVD